MATILHSGNVITEKTILGIRQEYTSYFDDCYLETVALYWTGSNFIRGSVSEDAKVDAPADLIKKYYDEVYAQKVELHTRQEQDKAMEIVRGCVVEVYKGRKVPKGIKGKVVGVVSKDTQWGYETKVGIATSDVMVEVERNGKKYMNHRDVVWVKRQNVKRIDPAPINVARVNELAAIDAKSQLSRFGVVIPE